MDNQFEQHPDEALCDLQSGSLYILQKNSGYRFSMDSVLLADFARVRPNDQVVDLGTGEGVLPLLLYSRETSIRVNGLEINPDMADMAARSVRGNHLENQILIHCCDFRKEELPRHRFDLVVSNPPYEKNPGTTQASQTPRSFATQEISATFDDIVRSAALLLKHHGRFCCCMPANRLDEVLETVQKYRIAPKRLRFVHTRADRQAYLFLMEGMFCAKQGLQVLPPLIVLNERGETDEIKRIYREV